MLAGSGDDEVPVWREVPPVRHIHPGFIKLSGLERSMEFLSGRVDAPAFQRFVGFRMVETGLGETVFELPIIDWLRSAAGMVGSGVIAYLADAPMGAAVINALPPGGLIATSEMSINFLRPVPLQTSSLVARGRLVHKGRAYVLAECRIEDPSGSLVAFATSRNLMVFLPLPDATYEPAEKEPSSPDHPPDPYLRPARGSIWPTDVWQKMSGLEIVRGQLDGTLPPSPATEFFGTRLIEADEGRVSMLAPASPWMTGPAGRLYGGATALFANAALFSATLTSLPAGTAAAPLDQKVQYLRPIQGDGRDLTVRAWVVHRGQGMAVANAEVRTPEDKVAALSTATMLLLPGFSWATDEWVVPADQEEATT